MEKRITTANYVLPVFPLPVLAPGGAGAGAAQSGRQDTPAVLPESVQRLGQTHQQKGLLARIHQDQQVEKGSQCLHFNLCTLQVPLALQTGPSSGGVSGVVPPVAPPLLRLPPAPIPSPCRVPVRPPREPLPAQPGQERGARGQ